jgi:3-dehydroquinate synthase
MSLTYRTIRVGLPRVNQELIVGQGLGSMLIKLAKDGQYDQLLLVADARVYSGPGAKREVDRLKRGLKAPLVLLPDNIRKDYGQVGKILRRMHWFVLSRRSCLVVIGGGHLGDLMGFIASVYMRGITMIYVPTTMMSQCDSIVGKVAINFLGAKNLLGSFYSPRYTICDTDFLGSLSPRQIVCGLVEVWKHAIVGRNALLMGKVEHLLVDGQFTKLPPDIISESLRIKVNFVKSDPYDANGRHKALSLGHTIANYLERDPMITHGEAVAYGILFTALIASRMKKLQKSKLENIVNMFSLFHRYIEKDRRVVKQITSPNLLAVLSRDKINTRGCYNFVIPTNGGWGIAHNVGVGLIKDGVSELVARLNTL